MKLSLCAFFLGSLLVSSAFACDDISGTYESTDPHIEKRIYTIAQNRCRFLQIVLTKNADNTLFETQMGYFYSGGNHIPIYIHYKKINWSIALALLTGKGLPFNALIAPRKELWLWDTILRDQVGGPFGPWLNPCLGRLRARDRPLRFIRLVSDHAASE